MGLWSTVKGWLNIGGVSVKLDGVPTTVKKTGGNIAGRLNLATKSDKQVLKIVYKLVQEKTTGSGDDKKTEQVVYGQSVMNTPFEMKTGESKTLDFNFTYQLPERLADKGGMLGAVGKLGAFASGEKLEHYIIAECDVKGTPLDPSDRVKVQVV